eukprot:scaffold79236_cov32-Tisochrysis_lutea.AAC.1
MSEADVMYLESGSHSSLSSLAIVCAREQFHHRISVPHGISTSRTTAAIFAERPDKTLFLLHRRD